MSDELLSYYNRELAFIRRMGAEFAEANPKIAGRLKLSADAIEDPHVSRLIEAFAFLSARIRVKLDDEFPEVCDALMGVLYPHYQAPVPSMAIVQMVPQSDLGAPQTIDAGTGVETLGAGSEPCRFRTCFPVTVWPIRTTGASLAGRQTAAPQTPHAARAASVLRISLASSGATFSELGPDRLRFYLRGQEQHAHDLYELLLNGTLEVAVASSPEDPEPLVLGPEAIEAVGFERDEGLLPYSRQSFMGYRLLTEFFAFPEKFLFFDIRGLSPKALACEGETLDLFFYFRRSLPDLERHVDDETFVLGCAPVVNLFSHRAEPIRLTQTVSEYRVVPDARRPRAMEVYSIDEVVATSPDGEQTKFTPFFGISHAARGAERQTFWYANRRDAGPNDPGTEVYLSLVDLDFDPRVPADWTLDVRATCLNRDLPNHLPFGGGEPRMQLSEGGTVLERVVCLTSPTPTHRPPRRNRAMWRLISHLSLNHLSLADDAEGAEALREIIRLYDMTASDSTEMMIDGIVSVSSRRVAGRVGGGLAHGIEVAVDFDRNRFAGSGLYLFASVLERFLAHYSSINSFTRLTATVNSRHEELRRWPPRTGDRVVL